MGFWLLVIIIYLILVFGLTYLAFYLPKRKGRKKLGIVLAIIVFLFATYPITSFFIEDVWFFKSDVTEILSSHDFELQDDFVIKSHKILGLRDYSQEFIIEISQEDRERLINQIQNAPEYHPNLIEYPFQFIDSLPRYTTDSTKVYRWYYQRDEEYGYQYYKPRHRGLAPILENITLYQDQQMLKYELIID